MALTAQITLSLIAHESTAGDISRTLRATPAGHAVTLTNGTGAGQAQVVWSDSRTISNGGYEDLDFQALTDDRGTIGMTEVVAVYIKNTDTSGDHLLVGMDWNDNVPSSPVPWAPRSHAGPLIVRPGTALFFQPAGGGFVDGNGRRMRISADDGGTVTYEIVAIGKGSIS